MAEQQQQEDEGDEEHIRRFVQYGAPAERVASLPSSTAEHFLPALVLSASDSPRLLPSLLPSLYSHWRVPRALAYARLDYVEIARSVLEAEETETAAAGAVPGTASAGVSEKETKGNDDWEEESRALLVNWENDDDAVDECSAFEAADERERARLAILSVRRRACRWMQSSAAGAGDKDGSLYVDGDEGSMWSNEACFPELMCLLPVAASRSPNLLTPEILVKGLLSTSDGCSLLVTAFVNNPGTVERGVSALAQILSQHGEASDNQSGSPPALDIASAVKSAGGGGGPSREHSGGQPQDLVRLSTALYTKVIAVIIGLCRIAPSFAAICRETLVNSGTLAEIALHITVEIFHDELEFLSKLIFCKEKISRGVLLVLGAGQRHVENEEVLPPLRSKDADPAADTKVNSTTKPRVRGVATKVRDALLADARVTWKTQGRCGKLHAHLRLYCVLIRAGDLQPTHEEVDFWIRLLGGTSLGESKDSVRRAFVSERTLELGISFVCLVPGLSTPTTKVLFLPCIANLLRAAMGGAPYGNCTPEIELAVWVAVQLHLRQFTEIAGLVREALGMHVTVQTSAMRDLADAAVFDPTVVANAAATLRPPGPIFSSKTKLSLGLKCVEQLLIKNTFVRYGVDISDTVMHYLCITEEPIHPALPLIVQEFTPQSVPAPRGRRELPRFRMRPFSSTSLVSALAPGFAALRNKICSSNLQTDGQRVLLSSSCVRDLHMKGISGKTGHGNPLATAALVTFYVLCREQIVRSMGIPGGSVSDNPGSFTDGGDDGWWMDLLGSLPLRELLLYMETSWPAYEHLLPQWLSVASLVFPERLTAQSLLLDLDGANESFQTHVKGVPLIEDLKWACPGEVLNGAEAVDSSSLKADSDVKSLHMEQNLVTAAENLPSMGARMGSDDEQEVVSFQNDEGKLWKTQPKSVAMNANKGKPTTGADFLYETAVATAMRNAIKCPLPALRILNTIMETKAGCKLETIDIVAALGIDWHLESVMMRSLLPNLLNDRCPRCLQDQFCSWWQALPSSASEYLVPVLWDLIKDESIAINEDSLRLNGGRQNAVSKTRRDGIKAMTLSSSGLAEEPLKLLACNRKIFRSPLLGIVLEILLELLVANRRICQVAILEGGRGAGIKHEEVASALVAQDSAVCQILLEACLPKNELDDEKRPGPLLEARHCICAAVCTLLYRSPLLLKLVHFQGYDERLIPMMVEGVPAMVQCLDFISELLQQPHQQQLVFAAALTAHLTSAYSELPLSLSAAQQVVKQVSQMQAKVAGCAPYLQGVLGAVVQCASTFPSLAPQVIALLQSCAQAGGPLTRSGPPRDAALHAAAIAAFKCLVQDKLLHGHSPPIS